MFPKSQRTIKVLLARYCLAGEHAILDDGCEGPRHSVTTSLRSSLDTQSLVIFAMSLQVHSYSYESSQTGQCRCAPSLGNFLRIIPNLKFPTFKQQLRIHCAEIEFVIRKKVQNKIANFKCLKELHRFQFFFLYISLSSFCAERKRISIHRI